ncbi:hypothetical protein F5883DRAFT_528503 [Diaporthe sp. PMI_573]|nr:hypothetical protein F5883DRAFT_528503 [Diaporthaceae sp. PMI_573]
MAQYYQFSYLTIAGTMSDTTNGLLCAYPDEYAPWGSQLVRMPYRNKTCVQTGHFFVYKRRVPAAEDYWTTVRESILLRRGWVLQEWLLTKRLLWYTSKGLFFECHTGVMRTEYRETIWVENAKPDLQSQLRLKGSFHFGSPSILDFWYRALELYSSCHLTKPGQDRILAVAGIAKETGLILANKVRREAVVDGVHHEVYEVYVAGLWLRDLHHGLIWEEDHSAPPCTTKVDQAPSWSWASLVTPVKCAERDEGTKKELKVTGLCLRRRDSHDHPPDYVIEKGWMARRLESTNGGIGERARFDPTNMFACLHTRGKVRTVHVRGYLEIESYLETAATATAYGKHPTFPCQ